MNRIAAVMLPPTLLMRTEGSKQCWELHLNLPFDSVAVDPDYSYYLEIKYYHGDENPSHFKFFRNYHGDKRQIVTEDQWQERYNSIVDNEDMDAALEWANEDTCDWIVESEFEPQFKEALIERWNAMLSLRIFTPHVTLNF